VSPAFPGVSPRIRQLGGVSVHRRLPPIAPNEKNVRKFHDSLKFRKLPPIAPNNKHTVFLDLDNTLIHCVLRSSKQRPPRNYDFIVKYPRSVIGYVTKRPFLDKFLDDINRRNLEFVIFTAGTRAYASPLLDILDPKGLISHRLYRDSCTVFRGKPLAKELSCLGRDLKNVVIIDDNPSFTRLQPSNAIWIKPFFGSLRELLYIAGVIGLKI
ncbi:Dullard phosphatase domain containing protein, eukaryotic, partial [Tanacetum coccineum]